MTPTDPDSASIAGVDFYLLESAPGNAVDRLACRVVDKAYRAGHRTFLLARDDQHCRELDELLWSFSQGSFVPHALAEEDDRGPVVIAAAPPDAASDYQVVVTLAEQPLAKAFHHLRIADMIGASDADRQAARHRYRYYREQGLDPRTHRL